MIAASRHWSWRLPFYYGWIIIGVAFITMAIAVTARTAFSMLLPPLIDEFGWDRGLTAGAFSFGFFASALLSPVAGRLMDRNGPRVVIGMGVCLMGLGLFTAPMIRTPWQLYATLGFLVAVGAGFMTYTAHSLFLPHWFVRRRALAISIAFAGAGIGGVVLLPWLQSIILRDGWRSSCSAMGMLVLFLIGPLSCLLRRRPEDIGLLPDGGGQTGNDIAAPAQSNVVDPAWAAIDWTLLRAMRTTRFWWIALAYFCAMIAWYVVQVHQTKYLMEIGFPPIVAAWSLGAVSVVAIPGQIALGAVSDRIGREWIWAIACGGFAVCYISLIALERAPTYPLLYTMIISQGFFGYAVTSVMGPIVAEIFEGRHYGSIFGTITVALTGGGAAGPWMAGVIHDATGSYRLAFVLVIACCGLSAAAVWITAPRTVRVVPGRVARR